MKRITYKDLEAVVKRINQLTKSPEKAIIDNKWQIGAYCLSYAYGGVNLHRISNDAGGVDAPIGCGHVSKRELFNLMQAYISGLIDGGK